MPTLQYKDFEGSAEIDTETLVCRGKILYIDDLVTYEANSPANLVQEFHAAVDDYLETCAQIGKSPQKQCKGQFNVRITPELHRQAQRRATVDETSLNAVVASALNRYLYIHRASEEARAIMPPQIEKIDATSKNVYFFPSQPSLDEKLVNNGPVISTASASSSHFQQFH